MCVSVWGCVCILVIYLLAYQKFQIFHIEVVECTMQQNVASSYFATQKVQNLKWVFLQWFECRCLVSAIDLRLALLGCINCGLRMAFSLFASRCLLTELFCWQRCKLCYSILWLICDMLHELNSHFWTTIHYIALCVVTSLHVTVQTV